MTKLAPAFLAGLWLAGPSTALATGSLSCSADDKTLTLQIESSVGHGMGEPFSNVRGEAEIHAAEAPDGLRQFEWTGDDLVHHWLGSDELKLKLYRDRQGGTTHASIELTIETKADEAEFEGQYVLRIYEVLPDPADPKDLSITGKVSCSLE